MNNKNIEVLKEVGYMLLLIVFFIGILAGIISFKTIENGDFENYKDSLVISINESISGETVAKNAIFSSGIKTIGLFWIIGMSIVGAPFLIGYVGYKGYSLGYSISAVLKAVGCLQGNKYIFRNLFVPNLILMFIIIYLANYSLKILKNFMEDRQNIKQDFMKFSLISIILAGIYAGFSFLGVIL